MKDVSARAERGQSNTAPARRSRNRHDMLAGPRWSLAGVLVLAATISAGACASTSNGGTVSTPQTSRGGGTTAPTGPVVANDSRSGVVPTGQELDVRLQSTLSSETAAVEQRFEATTAVDLMQNGRVLVPAGSVVRGVVSGVEKAGRVERTGKLTLSFDRLSVRGRDHEIRATATDVFKSGGILEEKGTAGVGAGAGAIVGGILGGVKGAVLGAVIGAGGAIAATDGKDVELPAGSVVRIRFDTPVSVV